METRGRNRPGAVSDNGLLWSTLNEVTSGPPRVGVMNYYRAAAAAVILIWSGNCLGADAAQRRHIEVAFDYSAAEVLLHALESGSSAEAQMPAVLQNHGVAATIK